MQTYSLNPELRQSDSSSLLGERGVILGKVQQERGVILGKVQQERGVTPHTTSYSA
ncbi:MULTISPECIES: hypothetical protein [Marinomonas]|uniref:Uncharacterized protein n=1 Tax=Marinomonas rhodophyticola TaxID=2992803 RepID=A0ABT3KJG1_9GAMM|nr:hypothetical protein [Marinomonas sp. KJ51-3]MCW4630687.1 hypothetical protein [Marinomonas sp. KJ51-3]